MSVTFYSIASMHPVNPTVRLPMQSVDRAFSMPTIVPMKEEREPPLKAMRMGDKGIGVLATRKVPRGTRLLVEQPALRVTQTLHGTQVQCYGDKRRVHGMLGTLSRAASAGRSPLDAVVNTNGFLLPQEGQTHSFTFLAISRLNHSCAPNAELCWDPMATASTLYAIQDIERGQEVTIDYGYANIVEREERQRALFQRFNFECRCERCNAETLATKRVRSAGRLSLTQARVHQRMHLAETRWHTPIARPRVISQACLPHDGSSRHTHIRPLPLLEKGTPRQWHSDRLSQ